MRLQYELRSILLALSVGACGRFDVDLLPQARNTDTPQDAQAETNSEDAAAAPQDVGVATPDASASQDAGAPLVEDGGAAPAPPNLPLMSDAAISATAGDAGAALADGSLADAATLPPVDAGTDAAAPPCAGSVVLGLCWYLGAGNTSCNDVCATHGGFDTNANGYVGSSSQGGSLANCQQVLSALGIGATVKAGMRSDGNGIGCHLWNDGSAWWLDSPAATPDIAIPEARIACGCKR
jgi:hypothetical protein